MGKNDFCNEISTKNLLSSVFLLLFTVEIDKRYLFSLWLDTKVNQVEKARKVFLYVLKMYAIDCNIAKEVALEIEKIIGNCCVYYKKLWNRQGRSKEKVLRNYSKFLNLKRNISFNFITRILKNKLIFFNV